MSLVSIIVPVYNVEDYLKKCVDSIIAQTYSNIEIILVDDGSTDSSSTICDTYKAIDSRIRVIHKENGGLSDARNAGIDIARGKYLSFIDSDDYIESSMIEDMVKLAEENKCKIVISNMMRFFSDGEIESFYEPVHEVLILEGNLKFETLKQPSVCNKLFSAELFTNIRFPEGKYYEDTFIYHELVYQVDKVVFSGKTGYWYLSRKGSILGREQYTIRYFDFIEAVSKRMIFLNEKNVKLYGTEACLSLYIAYCNALKYIPKTKETYTIFLQAKKWYEYAYRIAILDKTVSIKQKVKLILLKYLPFIHVKLF